MRTLLVGSLLTAACTSAASERPSAEPPPPWGVPITGGTMLVTRDGRYAVVADPDRDRLVTVELARAEVVGELALTAGDEPGRLIEDGAGRIQVALRRGGALLTLDALLTQATRRAACAEPRGLAWDAAGDVVHLACAGGELMTFPAADGPATRVVRLDRDLRDVVVVGEQLLVTRFRSAEVLTVAADGTVAARATSPTVQRAASNLGGPVPEGPDGAPSVDAIAAVAWRMVRLPDGGALMLHQRQVLEQLSSKPGGYGGRCDGPVEPSLTVLRAGQAPVAIRTPVRGTLPVDLAISASGRVAVVTAGDQHVQVSAVALDVPDNDGGGDCLFRSTPATPSPPTDVRPVPGFFDDLGAPTSVAWTPAEALVTFYPELPGLVIRRGELLTDRQIIRLPGDIGYDSGRALFHRRTGSGLACASCHPEGREDGLAWDFAELGLRRTQSLAGGILARAPYHWTGDELDLPTLMQDVFAGRMGGGVVTRSERLSLGPWLDRLPAPAPTVRDAAAAARGRQLFESAAVGCASCHGGPQYSTNQRFDVGTGGVFKTPSLLGVAARTPLLHDGCAETLQERFTGCGGGAAHGATAQLTTDQLAELIAYLESL